MSHSTPKTPSLLFFNWGHKLEHFKQQPLRVIALEDVDYPHQLKFRTASNGDLELDSGISVELFSLIEFALNLSYVPIRGDGWPDILPNGSWTGIGRQIMDDVADLSITISAFVPNRMKDLYFFLPVQTGYLTASFRQPRLKSLKNFIVHSFSPELWTALLICCCLFAVCIFVMGMARRSLINIARTEEWINEGSLNFDNGGVPHPEEGVLSFKDVIHGILSTICFPQIHSKHDYNDLRFVYISLSILTIVTFTAFSATLMSTLGIEENSINNFNDLVKSKLKIYGDKGASFTHVHAQLALAQRGVPFTTDDLDPKYILDMNLAITKVVAGGASFFTFDGAADFQYRKQNLTDEFICSNLDAHSIPGTRLWAGWFAKKGTKLKELINPKLVALHEMGFVRRVRQRWAHAISPMCIRKKRYHSIAPLDVKDVHSAYVVLYCGLPLAVIIFILEFITNHCLRLR